MTTILVFEWLIRNITWITMYYVANNHVGLDHGSLVVLKMPEDRAARARNKLHQHLSQIHQTDSRLLHTQSIFIY